MGRNRTQTSLSNSKYCFRSAKQAAPALGLVQSLWALDERELPIDRSLEIACSEGSEYLEIGLREERLAESKALLNRFPLKLIAQGWATSADDSIVFFQRESNSMGSRSICTLVTRTCL